MITPEILETVLKTFPEMQLDISENKSGRFNKSGYFNMSLCNTFTTSFEGGKDMFDLSFSYKNKHRVCLSISGTDILKGLLVPRVKEKLYSELSKLKTKVKDLESFLESDKDEK